MSTAAVTAFLAHLRKAQLLDEPQLAEAERLGQAATKPAEVATELMKRGWLTSYQANQVARGKGAELVLGGYVILESIGQGGMGQVVKAQHRVMERKVALKLIRHDQRDSADTIQRFKREVRLLADLRHPHIVHAYDAGNIGDIWYLAMELLEGIDLDRYARQRGPLPIGEACAYIRQAALGLAHAHERGLVHRDIKPSNLFKTSEGIKVLDLGLARPQMVAEGQQPQDLTQANTVMGTPDYLAPEQAIDPRRADARSDIYSLGCTLYALLAGRPPFPEGTLAQKLLSHQNQEPPPVEALRRDVPPALALLVRRMLAKNPAQRPAGAAEVAAELAPFAATALAGDAITAVQRQIPGGSAAPASSALTPGPSLVTDRALAPEAGWTVAPDSLGAATASLVNSAAPAPEAGWTVAAESLPPMTLALASAAEMPAPSSVTQRPSLPVAAAVLPTSASSTVTVPAAVPATRVPTWMWIAGAGAGGLLVLVVLVVALSGGRNPSVDPGPAANNGGKIKEVENPGPPASKMFPKGPRRFLVELEEFDVKHGFWPVKKGDIGDGKPIKVNGVHSPNGLGMHPPNNPAYSAVKFRLEKEAELFKATVAIDDSSNWCWSPPTFTLLGDGKELWQSKQIGPPHNQRSQECQVIVKGVEVLELRVQVPNLNQGVVAVWTEPRILQKFDAADPPAEGFVGVKPARKGLEPKVPSETSDLYMLPTIAPDAVFAKHKTGDKVFLSDMNELAAKTGPLGWKFAKNGRLGDPKNPEALIQVSGMQYPKGLGMHPPFSDVSRVCFALGKKARTLHGSVALDDGQDSAWKIKTTYFAVIGDGNVLWRSQGIAERKVVEPFTVDVRDVAVLELRVYTDYRGANGSRAAWLDPNVVVAE